MRVKFGFSRQRAYQLIDAVPIAVQLSTAVDTQPTAERQLRELARVPEHERVDVWNEAVERAGGDQPTGAQVAAAARARRDEPHPSFERSRLPGGDGPERSIANNGFLMERAVEYFRMGCSLWGLSIRHEELSADFDPPLTREEATAWHQLMLEAQVNLTELIAVLTKIVQAGES